MKLKAAYLILSAIIILTLASVAQASNVESGAPCYQPARLWPGGTGRVTSYPNLPNRIRTGASYYSQVLGYIPAGGSFSIVSGPYCESGVQWWQVNYNGTVGWTVEGNGATYYLEPINYTPPATCVLPNRLGVGSAGRVTPGSPNIVRSAPGTQSTGANSVVTGSIPGGGVFAVSGGPTCGSDGRWWWYVNYNGLTGWTAEGEGYNSYWLEPWGVSAPVCPNFLPSRLVVGGWGRVSTVPYLPNNIRSFASYSGGVIGQIPAGAAFSVLSGPICGENTAWFQVNYNGVVGWTVEGNGSTYWLEPA